jgi:sigma-B regulation protein RsbU (phosphoserine phosphatase)
MAEISACLRENTLVTAENLHSVREADSSESLGRSAILVVDDSEANREALCRRLESRGYTVTAAANGARALELVTRGSFDLVLLDIVMPGHDGLEVLQILRQRFSAMELPVIMATGMDESENIVQALELGANDYVTKPLDLAVVLARVQTHLSLKRSVRQIRDLEERLSRRNAELETANTQLEATNAQLARAHDHMRHDMIAAAKIQGAFLPRSPLRIPGMNFAWVFRPCEELAGDSLNICPLDADHVGVYILDVSGHGVAAALLAVTVTYALSAGGHPGSLLVRNVEGARDQRIVSPAEVAELLNQRFPCDPVTGQFFTIAYGVVNVKTRELCYVSAGHPPGIYLAGNAPPTFLAGAGLPVGLGGGWEQHVVRLNPGDRLYLYTDGVTDAVAADGRVFGSERLFQAVEGGRGVPLQNSISLLLDELYRWSGAAPLRDDVSVLAMEAT